MFMLTTAVKAPLTVVHAEGDEGEVENGGGNAVEDGGTMTEE